MPQDFEIEYQYQEYLKRMALSEDRMHPEQKKQLRETFYGACGVILILLRDQTQKLAEDDAIKAFQYLLDQVGDFLLKRTGQQN